MKKRSIKVDEGEYDLIMRAREELARWGYDDLPLSVDEASIKRGDFTFGAVAALGAKLIIEMLEKNNGGK